MLVEEEDGRGADFVVDFGAVNGGRIEGNPFVKEHFAPFGGFVEKYIVAGMAGFI